jgi:F1F0 ATPase subunit 2
MREDRVTALEISIGALLAGMALGGIFFGGLWLTLRHTLSSAALGLWLVASLVLRMAIALAGFYFVSAGDWRRLIACLLGFVLARFMVVRVLQARSAGKCAAARTGFHAP